ncbi:MAG: hypothetical protein A3F43_02805 [Gammaproteobacteria bacterium RIFCSPHIGHO2_12_FULL_42_10]|nr:MAG: hypothetical protein A3F43_02805 [Gammaproteobacteria bacterium RIFCSPHIGHO2_12_FULL_42_10]
MTIQLTESQKSAIGAVTASNNEVALNAILNCRSIEELRRKTHGETLFSIKYQTASFSVTEALIESWNHIGAFVLIMDSFFTLSTALTLFAFFAFGSIFTVLLGISGMIYFVGTYIELKNEHREKGDQDQLLAIKTLCIAHKQKQILAPDNQVALNELLIHFDEKSPQFKPTGRERWRSAKETVYAIVLTTGTVFYTYYAFTLGLSVALAGSLFVGAMTGPIGLGIVFSAALLFGVVMGYKKYQTSQANARLENRRQSLKNTFNEYHDLYPIAHPTQNNHAPTTTAILTARVLNAPRDSSTQTPGRLRSNSTPS